LEVDITPEPLISRFEEVKFVGPKTGYVRDPSHPSVSMSETGKGEANGKTKPLFNDDVSRPSGTALMQEMQGLDADEQYSVLERHRLLAEDPGMISFVAAKRNARGSQARLKAFKGDKAKGINARKQEHVHALNFGLVQRKGP
jgi:hypothetical protein